MIRIITLHGEMSGSARIDITDGGTQVTLSLRGKRGGGALTAYLIGDERIIAVPISGLSGNAAPLDVRGILLARDGVNTSRGEFAAWGTCCGMTGEALNKAKARVRMMLPNGGGRNGANHGREGANHGGEGSVERRTESRSAEKPNSAVSGSPENRAGNGQTPQNGGMGSAQNGNRTENGQTPQNGGMVSAQNGNRAGSGQAPQNGGTGNAQNGNRAVNGQAPQNGGMRRLSPVTESILDKARELFSGLLSEYADNMNNSGGNTQSGNVLERERGGGAQNAASKSDLSLNGVSQSGAPLSDVSSDKPKDKVSPFNREMPARDGSNSISAAETPVYATEEAVINPFPSLFPNSYWKRKLNDDAKLLGTANVRGIKYDITAIRSSSRYPPRGLRGNFRRARARNGHMYWLGIVRK